MPSSIPVKVQFHTMEFEIVPEICASEKGEGEELIEIIGNILWKHYYGVDVHWFTFLEMEIPTCTLYHTYDNSRRLQPV